VDLKTLGVMLVAGGLVIAGVAAAEEQKAEKRSATTQAVGDEAWIKKAVQGGMAEVEMGKLATQKAHNPEVKRFAQHMVDDHSKVNDALTMIATDKGVIPPSQLDAKHMAKKKELMQAEGREFDKKYMEAQVQGHKEMIALFEQGAKNKDAKLKKFAKETLPNLKKHLQMAQNVQTKMAKK
jgi:putative membrane protein